MLQAKAGRVIFNKNHPAHFFTLQAAQSNLNPYRNFNMKIFLLLLAIIAMPISPAHAENVATTVGKDAARGSITGRLPVEALCAKLTLEKVITIMGKHYARRADGEQLFLECKYGDSKEKGKMPVRYFSLGSSILKEANWRKTVESGGKGKVTERDGVLVGDYRGDGFGALDEIWFKDKLGRALYLRANSGVSEDQAVKLAKAAME